MSIIEIIETLRKFNEWRRYDGQNGEAPEQPSPKEIGEAIDGAVELLSGKNNTTIEQIRAEVERMKNDSVNLHTYDELLSFLSALQEQPVCEGLEEEVDRYILDYFDGDDEGKHYVLHCARHFAQWQKEQDEKMLSVEYLKGVEFGKKDTKEQMLKEAVEGRVIDDGGDFKLVVPSLHTILKGTEDGEILKIIFISNYD